MYCDSIDSKVSFINFINGSRRDGIEDLIELRTRPYLSFLQRKRSRVLRTKLDLRLQNGETILHVDYKHECIR